MTHEQLIKEVASQVFNTNSDAVEIVERLMGGMSNYTYLITINLKRYTFRIPGKNADKFVDRENEQKNIELVTPLGLNNHTVFLDVKTGYKIAEYIEGQPLSELNPLDFLTEAANILHKIHESGLKAEKDYDPKGRLARYESHLTQFKYRHSARYLNLRKTWEQLAANYMDKSRLTLSHGDSQISNFLVTDSGLRLMDWEFTGNNDPYYDIACFGNNDFDHAIALLPVYLGKTPTTEELNRLYFFRAFQCLQWHNVALYKDFIGLSVDLGVDFMLFANLYLDKTEKFLSNIK